MKRRGLAGIGMGTMLALAACSGDDTAVTFPDAGGTDATIADGASPDATSAAEAGVDAGPSEDAGPTCVLVDAAMFSDAEVQAGLAIVTAMQCHKCHGDDLQGNSAGLPSTNEDGGIAFPPDLTPDPDSGLGCWTTAQIERAFLYGIDNNGQPMCNPMPRFGEEGAAGIDEAGAGEVVAYLRSIPAVSNPHITKNSACPLPVPVDAGVDAAADGGADAGDASVTDGGPHDAGDGGG
jgi:hypothetical protein